MDAAGHYVFPGGIDPHTHLDMPFGGTVTADDFETGTMAAAFGGTTTIIDFCLTNKGTTAKSVCSDVASQSRQAKPSSIMAFI